MDCALRRAATELATQVFSDPQQGLLALSAERLERIATLVEKLQAARAALDAQAASIARGGDDQNGGVSAPDRSCLLYDVIPPNEFTLIYGQQPDHTRELVEKLLRDRSPLDLLASSPAEAAPAESLAEHLSDAARSFFPQLAEQHILDVLLQGARSGQNLTDVIKERLTQALGQLGTFAPVRGRVGQGATYDYCVVSYPWHGDREVRQALESAADRAIRESNPRAGVSISHFSKPTNRIFFTYMQHGFALNDQAFAGLDAWRSSFERLSRLNPFMEVDKRWRKHAGPGQKARGETRATLFALGAAYGLIARRGDYFYSNFHPSLLRRDPDRAGSREEYDVDAARVAEAINASGSPIEWFAHVTRGPSDIQTIPQMRGAGLGKGKEHSAEDRIGQGRAAALEAFVTDQGEDYADVANAIALVLNAYVEAHGHAEVMKELDDYIAALREEKTGSAEKRTQIQHEIDLLTGVRDTLKSEKRLDLPVTVG